MSKDRDRRITAAAEALLSPGERVTAVGPCWAAQLRDRVPLLFLGRRQHLVALSDRRMLVFERSRRGPTPNDLVVGKRYETFSLERVKRHRPLTQVAVRAANGSRMVFEFRLGQRALAGELIARLTPTRDRGTAPPTEPAEDPVASAFWGSA
jgi:hypothetical protein